MWSFNVTAFSGDLLSHLQTATHRSIDKISPYLNLSLKKYFNQDNTDRYFLYKIFIGDSSSVILLQPRQTIVSIGENIKISGQTDACKNEYRNF